ncbi:hypothetical protein [Aquibium oceanicum]|uniref:hypothetical protein n=1 Tax=Aquibium oceanicum TaxID=1670800 RepID=UPI000AC771EA|nr:hypothetical protein [Aquibium oceanicum]
MRIGDAKHHCPVHSIARFFPEHMAEASVGRMIAQMKTFMRIRGKANSNDDKVHTAPQQRREFA